ncbi:flagellar hook-associated protein FlgK [Bradyrhizobium cenepequi]|uniref:flagellar hook-associated protein FlgK n=1 Tax=Bradyrhizobium cenepequi TaxID=2821403 RepID=UPI001CE2DA03|nr:flagellar hook-associated protein FlgK [Bradyrhizobium cenepequi]MCA6106256.1 flagellar hook-associated protein FlgK [Bradyrhizobium cenepequi]
MSLTVALSSARTSLMATSAQASVISRNIAGAMQDGYSRKNVLLATLPGNGVYVAGIQRATSQGLFYNVLKAASATAKQDSIYNGLQKIAATTVDDPQQDQSPAAQLAKLKSALQQYATAPDNITLAQTAVTAAKGVAAALNDATKTVQSVRADADADMVSSVSTINQLLAQFKTVNTSIVKGTITGSDITDYLDMRDSILSKLSQEVGITVATRANNDMVIYTDSGVTLFETNARSVTLDPTYAYTAGATGNAVYIDGVPVSGASAVMPIHGGKLAGLAALRDDATVTYQNQLDEIARGLIEAFAERDQTAAALPDVPGLFTYPGASAMPPSGVIASGLAGTIFVNPSVDQGAGGNPLLLRDGAISGNVAYRYNTGGEAGFSDRVQQLVDGMAASRPFSPLALGKPNASLIDFAGSSVSWLEAQRKSTNDEATYSQTLLERSAEALSNVSGVNMDDEMSFMLQVERTFSASSKLIATVDEMLKDLLAAVR